MRRERNAVEIRSHFQIKHACAAIRARRATIHVPHLISCPSWPHQLCHNRWGRWQINPCVYWKVIACGARSQWFVWLVLEEYAMKFAYSTVHTYAICARSVCLFGGKSITMGYWLYWLFMTNNTFSFENEWQPKQKNSREFRRTHNVQNEFFIVH